MLHKVSSLNTINDGISTICTSGQKICTKHSVFIIGKSKTTFHLHALICEPDGMRGLAGGI